MTTRKNQHHWATYQGENYTLRSLCLKLGRDYPNTHKKIVDHNSTDDLSWAFQLPEGSVLKYTPTAEEVSALKRANRMKSRVSTAKADTTPPALARFLTGARP